MSEPSPRLTDALRDRYTIERELGRGGMATVYLAHDHRHDRLVALKLLHAELARTLGPDRFQREIRLAAGSTRSSATTTRRWPSSTRCCGVLPA